MDTPLPRFPDIPHGESVSNLTSGGGPDNRPWIGVHFVCSNRYIRVRRGADGTAYLARCPSCGRCLRFRVGAGGSAQRFFEVSC